MTRQLGQPNLGAIQRFNQAGGWFATWQAERVIGDHDRNTLRLRVDPEVEPAGLEPGMTVWLSR